MQESLYVKFLSLVQFDQETNALHNRILIISKEIETIQEQQVVLQQMQDVAYMQWYEARKEVDAYELQMRELEEVRLMKNKRLEQASSTKEHQALRKEIDLLLQQQNDLEQKLILFWNLVDTRRKALQESTERLEGERSVLQTMQQSYEAQIAELCQQVTIREKEWQLHTTGLPEDLLQKYVMMRTAISDPVVPVEQGACTICYYALTQNDKALLQNNHLMPCKGCFRLLYLAKQPQ